VARLAQYFLERPARWIDGRELATIAGAYAWRTRLSELRRPPYDLRVENRQRRIRVGGAAVTISEYRLKQDAADHHLFRPQPLCLQTDDHERRV
jgi:hypothetical protein